MTTARPFTGARLRRLLRCGEAILRANKTVLPRPAVVIDSLLWLKRHP
jgi:hypothetical protein